MSFAMQPALPRVQHRAAPGALLLLATGAVAAREPASFAPVIADDPP